jgi:hypothetical protein
MTKNVLIVLNTNFHFETTISLYETLKLNGYYPVILLDYSYRNPSDYTLYDYNSEEFCKNFKLNYITSYTCNLSDKFDKALIVSGSEFLKTLEINKHIVKDFNDKIIFVFHRSNYSEQIEFCKTVFKNPKAVSVTNFSQKFNLPFIFQIENPIINQLKPKLNINSPIEFLVLGRFCWPNRSLNYIDEIISLDTKLKNPVKISIVGQKPFDENEIQAFKNKKLNQITIEVEHNISEIDFYNKIQNTDYILNLIDYKRGFYFLDRFSSNITHTIAFKKPSLCFMPFNLIYNIPSVEYTPKDFKDKFLECVNMSQDDYLNISNNFTEIIKNMRNHNTIVINNLLN